MGSIYFLPAVTARMASGIAIFTSPPKKATTGANRLTLALSLIHIYSVEYEISEGDVYKRQVLMFGPRFSGSPHPLSVSVDFHIS